MYPQSAQILPAFWPSLASCQAPARIKIWNLPQSRAYSIDTMDSGSDKSPQVGEDERLMLGVAAGDCAAFASLYDRFATPIFSLALKMLVNEAEAEDLLQEVFLSVWNKASTFQAQKGSAFAWVVSQARNRAIDRIRSRRRRGELIDANGPELEPSGSVVRASSFNAEISERGRLLRAALEQLTAEQRQVLTLAYFEGMTQVEIASRLAEPLGTIKARAHRGLTRLRAALGYLNE